MHAHPYIRTAWIHFEGLGRRTSLHCTRVIVYTLFLKKHAGVKRTVATCSSFI